MSKIINVLSKLNVMQNVHNVIRRKAVLKGDILYNQAGKKIGRYNVSQGYGWISFFAYQALLKDPDITAVCRNEPETIDDEMLG